jgi:hypothetical protein
MPAQLVPGIRIFSPKHCGERYPLCALSHVTLVLPVHPLNLAFTWERKPRSVRGLSMVG